jgi:hypothetical protein
MEKSLDILWEKVQGMQRAIDLAAELNETKLQLQAVEYERRLEKLNGEGDRIKDILKESIPREIFDRTMTSNDQRNETRFKEVAAKIEILTAWQTAQQGSTQGKDTLTKYIPWVIALIALAWGIFRPK